MNTDSVAEILAGNSGKGWFWQRGKEHLTGNRKWQGWTSGCGKRLILVFSSGTALSTIICQRALYWSVRPAVNMARCRAVWWVHSLAHQHRPAPLVCSAGRVHYIPLPSQQGSLSSSVCAAPCRQTLNVTISILRAGTHREMKQPLTSVWSRGETPHLPSATTNERLCLKELPCAVRITLLRQPPWKTRGDCGPQRAPLQLSCPLVPSGCS